MFGQRLEGIIINGVTKYKMREMQNQLAPMIEAIGVKVLAIVPESRVMLGFTVGELARHLGGTALEKYDIVFKDAPEQIWFNEYHWPEGVSR